MKKRIAALVLAALMLFGFVCSASAMISIEDETGVRYADGENPESGGTQSAFSTAVQKALRAWTKFWNRYGIVTVIVLLLAAIVIAIVISEAQRQKKEKRPDCPQRKHK